MTVSQCSHWITIDLTIDHVISCGNIMSFGDGICCIDVILSIITTGLWGEVVRYNFYVTQWLYLFYYLIECAVILSTVCHEWPMVKSYLLRSESHYEAATGSA